MTVFKGYFTLWRRNLKMVILYFSIFLVILIIMQKVAMKNEVKNYQTESLSVAVIDKDESGLSEGLKQYISGMHELVDIGAEEKDIQSALFYHLVDYVVIIPENFQKDYLEKGEKLQTTKAPGSVSAMYVDTQIDTFLNSAKVFYASGYTMEESVASALEASDVKGEVSMISQNGNGGKTESFVYFFHYFPYMIVAVIGYSMSTILMKIREKEIRQRIGCSSVSVFRQNMEGVLAFIIIGMVIWGVSILCMLGMDGKSFLSNPNQMYFLINSMLMTVTALTLSFLIGVVVKSEEILSGLVNTVSLGMCFLCGVFVPIEIMGKNVIKFSQFLPVYWFEIINDQLGQYSTLSRAMEDTMYKGFLVQLAFSAVCVALALMLGKAKQQDK